MLANLRRKLVTPNRSRRDAVDNALRVVDERRIEIAVIECRARLGKRGLKLAQWRGKIPPRPDAALQTNHAVDGTGILGEVSGDLTYRVPVR